MRNIDIVDSFLKGRGSWRGRETVSIQSGMLYSYNLPIARFVKPYLVFVYGEPTSVTTAKHIGYVYGSYSHYLPVTDVRKDNDWRYWKYLLSHYRGKYQRARTTQAHWRYMYYKLQRALQRFYGSRLPAYAKETICAIEK